jgi:flagellar basal body-associated protein FliL
LARQLEKGRVAAADKGRAASAEAPPPEPVKKRRPMKLILMAVVVLIVIGAGGWYFLVGGAKPASQSAPAPPAPFFVDIKPFVITMKAADGSMHYVQLSLSLKVPGTPAITAAESVMPEILDMIRQSVLGFKVDQLQTPQGVNRLRAVLVAGTNRVLLQSLGGAKIKELGGGKDEALVSAIYFSNLVIQ